jgi:serine protease SohB
VLNFLAEYGLFLAKVATFVIAIIVVVGFIIASATKSKGAKDKLNVKKINKRYADYKETLQHAILNKASFKRLQKAENKKNKLAKKEHQERKRVFVLTFNGDIKASATYSLREEVTAILTIANPEDEVVVRLESPGGIVPSYGLAASQLKRFREHQIPLTITVDKIAASGGYMMACVGNKILAAPYAIIGSIGVVAQLPNFHRLLKKNDIDFEQITAGEYKRTISMFGENTKKGLEKVQEDVNNIHEIFKKFIISNRPMVNITEVATGEHWHGVQALDLKLVDELMTSDDYLLKASQDKDIYEIHYEVKKSLADKLSLSIRHAYESVFPFNNSKLFS